MGALLPIAFTTPWLLAALALLPGLWWLLRATPPAPTVIRFPAIRLLYGLAPAAETAAHTPWWLLLLRLLLAALLILGFAGPVWHPGAGLSGSGPVVLVVDDGWAAARDWSLRQNTLRDLVQRAGRADRRILIQTTAPLGTREQVTVAPATLLTASAALGLVDRLQPRPWAVDRIAAARRLGQTTLPGGAACFWLSDGLQSPGSDTLATVLRHLGPLEILAPPPEQLPMALAAVPDQHGDLAVDVTRAAALGPRSIALRVTTDQGTSLAEIGGAFASDQTVVRVALPMPIEARNRAARIDLGGEATAGAAVLLDSGARVPTVGVVTPFENGAAQPLLSARYYIERALAPYGDLRHGTIVELLRRPLSVVILTDDIAPNAEETKALGAWVEAGGVLLRFAGEGLATGTDDPLLPVLLRQGGRSIGGAMSWETPAHLAPFGATSPFAGLAVPLDVTVSRQVLAEPAPDLAAKTWARLSDGTPLVTAAPRGRGSLVLFHTTANAEWSNLALSGLFVDMLRRVADLGARRVGTPQGSLAPWRTLDGFGALTPPPVSAAPIDGASLRTTVPGPDHPPGYYGAADQAAALNLGPSLGDLAPLAGDFGTRGYDRSSEMSLQTPLLVLAAALLLADILIGYAIRGLLQRVAAGLLAALLAVGSAQAATDEQRLLDVTGTIHLAYVETGDSDVDATARAGLAGLSAQLTRRTAVVPGEPMAVDIETDDLILFPVIYWPVTDSQPAPSPAAVARINQYLATGGVLLIDTRDQEIGVPGDQDRLKRLLAGVRVPPLEPIPDNHVLTRSFYLLRNFPGRWDGGTLWVEPPDEHVNDGVSTLIVGSNDWAAAWAVDAEANPIYPVEPGGEAQREMAFRFGINLVMYALTGNYKADQLHVGTILQRLGQ
jgi:hypothetical protein